MIPFKVNLAAKNLELEIVDKTSKNVDFICTDFRVYEGIIFHIINNAIKFSD